MTAWDMFKALGFVRNTYELGYAVTYTIGDSGANIRFGWGKAIIVNCGYSVAVHEDDAL